MKFSEMNVISIDPSLRSTGVYASSGFASAIINKSETFYQAMRKIVKFLEIRKPDIVLIEKQFRNKDQLKVYGAIYGIFAFKYIAIIEMHPRIWQSITGMGAPLSNCDKKTKSGQSMYLSIVNSMYGKHFSTTDEADAYMMYCAVCDIMDKPGRLTPAAEKIRLQIEEILK